MVEAEAKKEDPKPSAEEKARKEVCEKFKITTEQLEELKRQIGKISCVFVGGEPYVYRTLKRAELKTIRQGLVGGDEIAFEEKVAARCLVLPKLSEIELHDNDAGLASTLYEAVSQFSGYAPDSMPVRL